MTLGLITATVPRPAGEELMKKTSHVTGAHVGLGLCVFGVRVVSSVAPQLRGSRFNSLVQGPKGH